MQTIKAALGRGKDGRLYSGKKASEGKKKTERAAEMGERQAKKTESWSTMGKQWELGDKKS